MNKKVPIAAKPTATATNADDWVSAKPGKTEKQVEPTKRFTIDIPVSLHAKIKSECALRGVKMNEEIRKLLEQHFLESK